MFPDPVRPAPWAAASTALIVSVVGAIEILAAVLVAIKPRYASYVVALWLAGIIINLMTYPGFYDIALRDFGLLVGALALARLCGRGGRGAHSQSAAGALDRYIQFTTVFPRMLVSTKDSEVKFALWIPRACWHPTRARRSAKAAPGCSTCCAPRAGR
ncbi:MAG TPA: hypothetical protein VFV73_03460 [Streptosporangiaceae bacterium]|nr:hypothetical protein [Streptosporangiaceae bacterium]